MRLAPLIITLGLWLFLAAKCVLAFIALVEIINLPYPQDVNASLHGEGTAALATFFGWFFATWVCLYLVAVAFVISIKRT